MITLLDVLFLALFAWARLANANYEPEIPGRSAAGEARSLPTLGETSAEPRPVDPPETEKRADEENFDIEDAPQWTMDDLTRQFFPPQEDGLWSVQYDFILISTNSNGVINTAYEGVVSCTFTTYLQAGKNPRKESVWPQRCVDLDFYFSWGYIEAEDGATVTVMYINPDKDGKSRIAWTSVQDVNKDEGDTQQLGTPAPFATEEYVCRSDAWPCNQQS